MNAIAIVILSVCHTGDPRVNSSVLPVEIHYITSRLFKVAQCQRLLNHCARCKEQLIQLEAVKDEMIKKK